MVKLAERPAPWQQAPASVKAASGLLYLQATIWALLSCGIAYGDANVAISHPSKGTTTAFVVTVLLALAAGTFAAGKFWLAHRLPGGTHKTREAVITVEALMGGFAGLVLLALFLSVFGLLLSPPVIIGGIISALVAHGLTKPPARQYFDTNEAAEAQNPNLRSYDGGSPAQFRACLAAA
jgi:hypothetical protein